MAKKYSLPFATVATFAAIFGFIFWLNVAGPVGYIIALAAVMFALSFGGRFLVAVYGRK